MKKRWGILALGLLMLLTANLRPVYRVTVDGQALPGCYTREEIRTCAETVRETAEEILQNSTEAPQMQRKVLLTLRRADGDCTVLTDALLRSVRGVAVSDGVYVNGVRLGTVADGELFCAKLRDAIRNQMPNAAVSGNISGKLQIQRIYTRAGQDTPDEDMVLLVTGVAPVIYVDAEGKLA